MVCALISGQDACRRLLELPALIADIGEQRLQNGGCRTGWPAQDATIAIPKVGGMNDRSAWAAKLGCLPKNQGWLERRP
jgi:hypothetical protein